MSCSSCHQPAFYATGALPKPTGVRQRPHPRHVPTNLNAGTGFVIHWRGDRTNLEDQVFQALTSRRELGVRNVLEGSMRRAGQRVRISSQLTDTATGTHLWAERYDRDLTDIFAVQDHITSRVVAAIEPALSRAESQRVIAKRPEHMRVWDYCQRGFRHVHKGTRSDGITAYGLLKQALALDSNLADAHLGLARALIVQWDYGSIEDFAPFVRQARDCALQALALDSENRQTQYVLAQTSLWAGDARAAIAHASRAIELNANFALGNFYPGIALSLDGRHEEALDAIETGWRLSPSDPRASTWLANKTRVLYHLVS